jgi:hypothetical protein
MLEQSSEVGLGDRSSLHATLCARRLPQVTKEFQEIKSDYLCGGALKD